MLLTDASRPTARERKRERKKEGGREGERKTWNTRKVMKIIKRGGFGTRERTAPTHAPYASCTPPVLFVGSRIDCTAPRYTSGREVSHGSRPNTLSYPVAPCEKSIRIATHSRRGDFLERGREKEKGRRRGVQLGH